MCLSLEQPTRIIMIILFAFLPCAVAINSAIFLRGSTHMTIPTPSSNTAVKSEIGCALECSKDILCDFFHFTNKTCSLYRTPEWPADSVTYDVNSPLAFRAPLWKMGFKVSAGTGDVPYDVWSRPGTSGGGTGCSKDPGIRCSTTYKDSVIDAWEHISQVRIELYTNNTLEAYALVDARGTDMWSWMGVDKLLASSWTDILDHANDSTTEASVSGVSTNWAGQYRFIMNTDLTKQTMDNGGWFHILEPSIPTSLNDCNGHPSTQPRPLLRYSKRPTKTFLITYKNGVHLEQGPYPQRYSLAWAEAGTACAAIGETLASEQDLLDIQDDAAKGCCNCAWTADGTAQLIVGYQCLHVTCNFRTKWNAWCKSDIDQIGYADTMVMFVR